MLGPILIQLMAETLQTLKTLMKVEVKTQKHNLKINSFFCNLYLFSFLLCDHVVDETLMSHLFKHFQIKLCVKVIWKVFKYGKT